MFDKLYIRSEGALEGDTSVSLCDESEQMVPVASVACEICLLAGVVMAIMIHLRQKVAKFGGSGQQNDIIKTS